MPGRFELQFDISKPKPRARAQGPRDRMRILVLADLSGATQAPPLAQRSPVRVTIDNFDGVMARLAPSVAWPAGSDQRISFEELEHFHPDELCERVDDLREWLDARRDLENPKRFAQKAAELGLTVPEASAAAPAAKPSQSRESDDDMLARLMGRAPGSDSAPIGQTAATAVRDGGGIGELVRSVTAAHSIPAQSATLRGVLTAYERSLAERVRSLLRAPGFRALESNWRALRDLVFSVRSDAAIDIFVYDVSRDELAADLAALTTDPLESAICRQLTTGPHDRKPWSIVVTDLQIAPTRADLGLLAYLGALGLHLGGPVLADAEPALAGWTSMASHVDPRQWQELPEPVATAWRELRASPIATSIGLSFPKVLARRPYGARSDAVDAFDFEELGEAPRITDFAWAPGSFALARLLADAFAEAGWAAAPGTCAQLDDLPVHTWKAAGESQAMGVTQAHFSERCTLALIELGFMPIVALRNSKQARVPRFQSIAQPLAPLQGAWV